MNLFKFLRDNNVVLRFGKSVIEVTIGTHHVRLRIIEEDVTDDEIIDNYLKPYVLEIKKQIENATVLFAKRGLVIVGHWLVPGVDGPFSENVPIGTIDHVLADETICLKAGENRYYVKADLVSQFIHKDAL